MTLKIGDTAPDFEANTTQGKIKFHDWIGDHWAILFSHPKDFTPVCTTELGYMAKLQPEFDKRNTRIIGLSVDPVAQHSGWAKDIAETQDVTSRGWEFEFNYNPTPNWTLKLAGAEQKTIDSNLSPNIQRYLAERLPVWQSVINPIDGTPWWTTSTTSRAGSNTAPSDA